MSNWFIGCGGLFGAVGVASGAIGSHILKTRLSSVELEIFSNAVIYLLVHSAVLLVCGVVLAGNNNNRWFKYAGILMVLGILLFCGGLMLRSVTGIPAYGTTAPIGGGALILAWLAIAVAGFAKLGQSR